MKMNLGIKYSFIFILLISLAACSSPEVTPKPITRKTLPPTWTYAPTSIPTLTPIPFTETPKETTIPTEIEVPTDTIPPTTTIIPTTDISPINTLDPSVIFPEISEIQMMSKTSGWAVASNGVSVQILRTSDGGISWLDVTPSIESWSASIEPNEFCDPQLGDGYFIDEQRAWMSTLCIDEERPLYAFTSEAMLFTTDGGSSWQMSMLPPGGIRIQYRPLY